MSKSFLCLIVFLSFISLSGAARGEITRDFTRGSELPSFDKPTLSSGQSWSNLKADRSPLTIARRRRSRKRKSSENIFSGGGGGETVHIDINKATVKQLMILPLVDEPTAEAIVKYRGEHPFKTPQDIMNVPEVGPVKYRIMKHLITVEPGEGGNGVGNQQEDSSGSA